MASSLLKRLYRLPSTVCGLQLKSKFPKSSNAIHKMANDEQQCMYEEALRLLNGLQSNSEILAAARENRKKTGNLSIPSTISALEAVGMSLTDLDSLNVIHVAGTKGKGMTCAFTESILRHTGLRTGFFPSPHLVTVRERIRINGVPLTKQQFSDYFFTTFNNMISVAENTKDFPMPGYFRFLTCMAFYVFLQEKVDVAIIEAGIGGTYDSTNILRKPIVVGITSLGLEHQSLLGETLEEIADNKAGIMKENVPAITIDSHPPNIIQLLQKRSETYKCPLFIAPALDSYKETIKLGVDDGNVSRLNATLAIQLASCFLTKYSEKLHSIAGPALKKSHFLNEVQNGVLLPKVRIALEKTKWAGRFQVLPVNDTLCYYVDGAHTEASLTIARNWFFKQTADNSFRVLIFQLTGDRKTDDLLKPFAVCGKFHLAIFCPLIVSAPFSSNSDNWSALRSGSSGISEKCNELKEYWLNVSKTSNAIVFPSVDSTVNFLEMLSRSTADTNGNSQDLGIGRNEMFESFHGRKLHVLITGSLHLVGNFLSLLDPELR